MMRAYILLLLIFSNAYASEISLGVKLKSNEFSITDHSVARTLFMRLRSKVHDAQLVYGLRFKYDRHMFCVREPERRFHCHFYMKDLGEGRLQNFEKDHDFGKGTISNYLTKPTYKAGAQAKIKDGSLIISMEGGEKSLANELYNSMDLVEEKFLVNNGVKYESKSGSNLRCVKIQGSQSDYHACKVFVPLNKGHDEIEDEVITPPLS